MLKKIIILKCLGYCDALTLKLRGCRNIEHCVWVNG